SLSLMSEYHKIETLYERDVKTFKVQPGALKNSVYGLIKTWQWTEKIDGTNIRVIWEPAIVADDSGAVPAGRPESLRFGGKTDNAQINAGLMTWLQENVTLEKLREVFPDKDA